MAQIQSPETYANGDQVTAARMNNMVNGATLLPGVITDQTIIGTTLSATDDMFLVYDLSALGLRKVAASQIVATGADIKTSLVQPAAGGTDSLTVQAIADGNLFINGTLNGFFNITTPGELVVTSATGSITMPVSSDHNKSIRLYGTYPILFDSYTKFNTTDAVKLPTGTTAQRPATANQGDIRYNSTTLFAEVYNGSTWEAVGGGPFDATGGNKIIAPDAVATTPTSATFTSADGESVVVTSAGHSVVPGQVVLIATAVAGYSGKWTVVSANTNDFTFVMTTVAAPNSGSCTYKKSGTFKCHIFTSSGTFTAGTKASGIEVLVVGGGGGGNTYAGGGGGAVVYCPYYSISASQVVTITVGNGGAVSGNGGASVFGTITAGGGLAPASTYAGGASGNGGGLSPSIAGNSSTSWSPFTGNGGSGCRGAGQNYFPASGPTSSNGGVGGQGAGSNIQGIAQTFGGGGQGLASYTGVGISIDGGGISGSPGRTNSGGGGGAGAAGGSGIVIVRYPYWV